MDPTAAHQRVFLLLSGIPGGGKTRLARRLAAALQIPVIDKDDILERLFESKGVGDAAWRRALSRESDAVLVNNAKTSEGAVLVSFWHLSGMPPDSGTPINWLTSLQGLVVNVHCSCDPEAAAHRFLQRRRHSGHLDGGRSFSEVMASFRELALLAPPDIQPRICVDTSQDPDINKLVCEVRQVVGLMPMVSHPANIAKPCFRQVTEAEVGDAHALYLEVFKWLNLKGVRQWLVPLPWSIFCDRQSRGELFGYFLDNRLASVVTLANEENPYWGEILEDDRQRWIKSLAVARQWRGSGIGARVMQQCEATLGAGQIYLDCMDAGFLPSYYALLGYGEIGRKDITYPSGNTFAMVLMRKNIPEQPVLSPQTFISPATR